MRLTRVWIGLLSHPGERVAPRGRQRRGGGHGGGGGGVSGERQLHRRDVPEHRLRGVHHPQGHGGDTQHVARLSRCRHIHSVVCPLRTPQGGGAALSCTAVESRVWVFFQIKSSEHASAVSGVQ